ncbi:hypothetical protein KKC1_09910 [Calderihabitans maritimus]|uniref:Uncharacterized protein n=1 Tax=Calderihabitans maritimus TaxID=1246530 RepID=A0A1Z5HR80_9FIRM|nr:hypothetical protein KKC1_09910 [Calderihabitans maritimus]
MNYDGEIINNFKLCALTLAFSGRSVVSGVKSTGGTYHTEGV